MSKLFAPYDIAFALSEKGFREHCFGYYNDDKYINSHASSPLSMCDYNSEPEQDDAQEPISAPLWDQITDWFEHRYLMYISVNVDQTMEPKFSYSINQYKGHEKIWVTHVFNSELFLTKREARYEAIKHALTLI